jgi:hypothetical protein
MAVPIAMGSAPTKRRLPSAAGKDGAPEARSQEGSQSVTLPGISRVKIAVRTRRLAIASSYDAAFS